MSNVEPEDVEGVEADPEIARKGEYDGKDEYAGLASDVDSTRSASITSSIVRAPC